MTEIESEAEIKVWVHDTAEIVNKDATSFDGDKSSQKVSGELIFNGQRVLTRATTSLLAGHWWE